jgi:hypothetical protein
LLFIVVGTSSKIWVLFIVVVWYIALSFPLSNKYY